MELQLGQVLSQMMETMKGMQLQQAQLQQALQSSDKTVGEAPEKKSIDVLIKLLQNYIAPEPGEVALQHKFCLRQQQEGESIANYVAGLKGIGVKLRTYGEILQPLGTCNVNIKYRDSEVQGRVFIIDRKVDPVIGREWIRKLNIQFDINSIHKEENDITEKEFKEKLHKLLEQYRELFTEEIGEINNFQATYRLKAGTSPIFLKPRPVPLALRDQVENEIDRLEKEGILEKVAYSQWGTPVVPVIKQNGKVRLCADYRATLNKNIEDDNYPIPRIEEIFLS
ncbi:Uncharacterized protein K02A2.6 [Eumeta japonica]|uniref:Uncharacterized protein K02A2.6 n=1 Tax=Eumeta variegata TaxID=151549 RepID=A0A4C1X0Q3_EUMVA|nr:Uncharacterized protein K02A2.6 [Eumeta japonica]